ncbi:fibrinogen-like protein A [Crassostrea angulata]|uniref:fibrinogen-like protein A n=1 Tax=Magallana angulata TaxID=2784310 RepID=UPI0022B0D08F|nr:fibrinogen-like protein A [Crassostrea angulata]
MNGAVRISVLFCLCLVTVFGQEQFHGFFKFIGYQNSPETSFVNDQSFNKSMRECSSKCLKEDNCYFFDICKNSSLTSCYFYDNNVSSSASVESGACRRYELKQTCDVGFTSPCRCPTNMGDERCNHKYDCSGRLVDRNTSSYSFYKTFPNSVKKEMWCEMEIDNGGWIVFQRRVDGTTDFYRGWTEYENGFGDLANNFYMGNYYLHEIVKSGDYELRVDLEDQAGEWAYAAYTNFMIGGPSTSYLLEVSGFYGNASDSLGYHNGMKFTTYDRDNDEQSGANCAFNFKGAWWHKSCHFSNLNGLYGIDSAGGIIWFHWRDYDHSLVRAQMMVRRKIKHEY